MPTQSEYQTMKSQLDRIATSASSARTRCAELLTDLGIEGTSIASGLAIVIGLTDDTYAAIETAAADDIEEAKRRIVICSDYTIAMARYRRDLVMWRESVAWYEQMAEQGSAPYSYPTKPTEPVKVAPWVEEGP